jgi:hypothetical protein
MNEQDFRTALRQTMTVQAPPPPMSDAPVLEAAYRDRRRRRAMWAGMGSAAAVVAVAVGVAVLAPSISQSGGGQVGGQPLPQVTGAPLVSGTGATPSDGEPSFPNGQTDRTARSGTQYERGATLADQLAQVIPAGYDSPDLPATGGLSGALKYNQANYEDTVNGRELWDYTAYAPVTKGEGVGRLLVEVHTAGLDSGDGCGIKPALWGMTGTCTEVAVGGKRVGVVTVTGDDRFNQWAGYRHDDGTVVFVAQATTYADAGKPALDGLPFTTDQLAALAVDPRFKVV